MLSVYVQPADVGSTTTANPLTIVVRYSWPAEILMTEVATGTYVNATIGPTSSTIAAIINKTISLGC